MKKLLVIITAAVMLVGMMGTAAMAADAERITVSTNKNTDNFEFITDGQAWTDNSNVGRYNSAVNSMGIYMICKPATIADLEPGIYELYQLLRAQGGSTTDEARYDFYGKANSYSDAPELLGSKIFSNGNYLKSGDSYQYVGTYCFNGTADETIKIGVPYIEVDEDIRVKKITFEPINAGSGTIKSKSVAKRYTVTKGETLTMPIMPELLGETQGITWTTDCSGTLGGVSTDNGVFTYNSADVEATEDKFSFTGTLNGCAVTVIVTVNITDDNAVYFDDADGEATGEVKTVYNSGFGGSRKALGDDASFKWSVTGITAGVYDAYFYKTGEDGFDAVQDVTVNYNGKSVNTSVSTLVNGKEGWVKIGTFDFAGNGSEFIETSRKNTSDYYYAAADAIKLVPVADEINRKIALFEGQTYKESALLTFAKGDSDYLPEIISGNATAAGNTIVYKAEAAGTDSFTVSCGEYVINYDVTVSAAPETVVAETEDLTFNGIWSDSTLFSHDGVTLSKKVNALGANVKWVVPEGTKAGYYRLQVWKHSSGDTSIRMKDSASFEVKYNNGSDIDVLIKKDIRQNTTKSATSNSTWGNVSTYYFGGNGEETITMTDLDTNMGGTSAEGLYFGGFRLVPVTDDITSTGTYKEDYAAKIKTLEDGTNFTSKFTIANSSQGKNANVIKAIYNNGALESIEFLEEVYIEPYSSEEIHHVFTAPAENDGDDKKVVIYLWDKENGLVPVANNITLD